MDQTAARTDDNIAALAGDIGRLGVELADVSGHIDDLSKVVDMQARMFADLSARAEEMTQGNRQVAEAAEESRTMTEQARSQVMAGTAQVDRSIKQILDLAEAAAASEDRLAGLETALAKVSQVARDIAAIAQQTNLLALNATIEAARAGEAGRGFAVVASEVKALSRKTSEATQEIDTTLRHLTEQTRLLLAEGRATVAKAHGVRADTGQIGVVMTQVSEAMEVMDTAAQGIAAAATEITQSIDGVQASLVELTAGVTQSSGSLDQARDRLRTLMGNSERLIRATATLGVATEDTPFIDAVQAVATQVAALFEGSIASGQISEADLFDEEYQPIPGTEPQQVLTRFTDLTDRLLPPIQEPMLQFHERVVFCLAIDRNGYIPTHNLKFSQPQRPGEVTWNTANSRNRRIFNDRVGLAAGQNREPFLLQTYRRDMGGGTFALMKDVSAPIWIRGRHWGGVRLAYRV